MGGDMSDDEFHEAPTVEKPYQLRPDVQFQNSVLNALEGINKRLARIEDKYDHVVEVLPIARRTADAVEEILDHMDQGGRRAKRLQSR